VTQLLSRLEGFEERLGRAIRQVVNALTSREQAHATRLEMAGREVVRGARERLLPLVRTLNAVSPLATLDRGYAIVVDEHGKILRDAAHAADGEIIEARLAVGRIRAKVLRP
jgi:exodeoxyribonuclease VII large subunit